MIMMGGRRCVVGRQKWAVSTPRNVGKKSQVSTAKFHRGRILQASLTSSYRQRPVPGLLLQGNLKHPDIGSTALKHLSLPLHISRTCRSEHALLDAHRRSSPPRWRRRDAEEGSLRSSLGSHASSSRGCATTPRLGSGLVVLVAATPPVGCLVAALGGAVEPLIRAPQAV